MCTKVSRVRVFAFVLLSLLGVAAWGAPHKEMSLWIARDVAPGPKVRVVINTQNVPSALMSIYPVNAERYLRSRDTSQARPKPSGKAVASYRVSVATKDQRRYPGQTDMYYNRQVNLPNLAPGVYLLSLTDGSKEAWAVVNVTHLAVVKKRSPKKMLVWVTDFKTGKPVPGAEARVYDAKGVVRKGTTKADGTALLAVGPGAFTVIVQRGKDYAGLSDGADNYDGRLAAHLQTDRPIYRPGHRVYFKAIVRRTLGQGYSEVVKRKIEVVLKDAKDNPIDRLLLDPTPNGTVSGQFDLSPEAMHGDYTLALNDAGSWAYSSFEVAAYRKPNFQVTVAPVQKRYLAGEAAAFLVDARFFFGSPVGQAEVQYVVRRSESGYWPFEGRPSYDDGNLYASDAYGEAAVVAQGTVHTADDGKVLVPFNTDPKAPDSNYSVTVTVTDSSRRSVEGASAVPVFASQIRLGLRTTVYCTPLGSNPEFELRAVDLDGKPTGAKVDVRCIETIWDNKEQDWIEKVVATTTVKIGTTGKAMFRMPMRAKGDLQIQAVADDGTGRVASAQAWIWVDDPNAKVVAVPEDPEVKVRLDKTTYRPGDPITAWTAVDIPSRPFLMVLESDDIFAYKVFPAGKNSGKWVQPTGKGYSPNLYVTACQWDGVRLLSSNALAPIPDPERVLTVKLQPDRNEYRPGDKAKVTVKTTNSAGQPVPAEVALGVVDEAIYAMRPDSTPDLVRTFWGLRANRVSTHQSAPADSSAGAYQGVPPQGAKTVPVRRRFEDTAFWDPVLKTGADGTGIAEFEIPGNLTEWRATVRALATGTRVGQAVSNFKANRLGQLRLAVPRQWVVGDKATLIVNVDNRTNDPHEFQVDLTGNGVSVVNGTQKLTVPAKSTGKVQVSITAEQTGTAVLRGDLKPLDVQGDLATELSDAVENSVPIVPDGVWRMARDGATLKESAELPIPVPEGSEGGTVSIRVWLGVRPVLEQMRQDLLRSPRYTSVNAASQLEASLLGQTDPKIVRDAVAYLAKVQDASGWGWWEGCPAHPIITARVLTALARSRAAGQPVYESLTRLGASSAAALYARTNLWEYRAWLASAEAVAGNKGADQRLAEVSDRGQNLSPMAKLKLAEGWLALNRRDQAQNWVRAVLPEVSSGGSASYLPVGFGVGWEAKSVETNAQLVWLLNELGMESNLEEQIVRWLLGPGRDRWMATEDSTAMCRALSAHLKANPESGELGKVWAEVGDERIELQPSRVDASASVRLTTAQLAEASFVRLIRQGGGTAQVDMETRWSQPWAGESVEGVRVLRRFETRNPAGVWMETTGTVQPGEPVRCTVLVWGDDLSDAIQVTEPLPSGFEVIDSEMSYSAREEVRDGAVVHFVPNAGTPIVFRYYLRAEAEGTLKALAPTAEYLRRPSVRGQGAPQLMVVEVPK